MRTRIKLRWHRTSGLPRVERGTDPATVGHPHLLRTPGIHLPRQIVYDDYRIGGAREATADEQRAIDKHREEHPNDTHHYWDEGDQSLLLARPQLRCTDGREKLTVPVRIL
jgi:hypothetical protein